MLRFSELLLRILDLTMFSGYTDQLLLRLLHGEGTKVQCEKPFVCRKSLQLLIKFFLIRDQENSILSFFHSPLSFAPEIKGDPEVERGKCVSGCHQAAIPETCVDPVAK